MTGRIEGKVAFVTGAARGQGRAHALRLAREGADIICLDVCKQFDGVAVPMSGPADLAETVARVEALGARVIAGEVDVRDYPAMKALVDRGVEEFGRLDIVIANAGLGSEGARMDRDDEQTRGDMTGVWKTVEAAIPHLLAGGRGGSIVITSSGGGLRGDENLGHYIAAQHSAIGVMRTLALKLGRENIRVNALCSARVGSPLLLDDHTGNLSRPDLESPAAADFAPTSRAAHGLRVDPEDVANAALFLVSDEARFITSVALPIDAGMLQK